VLWVGGLIALAALGFAGSGVGALPKFTSLGSQLFRYRRSIVTGCLLLAIANTLTSHGVRPTIITRPSSHWNTHSFAANRLSCRQSCTG
jgi:hypothetical protein